MLSKLQKCIREYKMLQPGDRVICALSGGADSMALLWSLYLLKEQLGIILEAAHFNHQLRGAQADADAAFVEEFCRGYQIPFHLGTARVERGEKGLEAAARDARYSFLRSLGGKLATAHTANDNAETVLLNMVRGSGLKGLGGISPVGENLIRPMLFITRREVEAFLAEYAVPHVEDQTNQEDDFLRNRLRHRVMPLLLAENPKLAENMSAMALQLRQDETQLGTLAEARYTTDVYALRQLAPSVRSRILERFLQENGVKEPSRRHLELVEGLVYSDKPSAKADLPGGVRIARCYQHLVRQTRTRHMPDVLISCPSSMTLYQPGLRVTCREATQIINTDRIMTVTPQGFITLGSRREGDALTLPGGTKSLKKLFIDRKIPALRRLEIPVLRDEKGILGVYGLGADQNRKATKLPAVQLVFEEIENCGKDDDNVSGYSGNSFD